MVLTFDVPYWLEDVLSHLLSGEPIGIVFAAAFGTMGVILVVAVLLAALKPIFKILATPGAGIIVFYPLCITWVAGFVSSMLMFFSGINGVYIALTILIVYVCTLMFCICNVRLLGIWSQETKDKKKVLK